MIRLLSGWSTIEHCKVLYNEVEHLSARACSTWFKQWGALARKGPNRQEWFTMTQRRLVVLQHSQLHQQHKMAEQIMHLSGPNSGWWWASVFLGSGTGEALVYFRYDNLTIWWSLQMKIVTKIHKIDLWKTVYHSVFPSHWLTEYWTAIYIYIFQYNIYIYEALLNLKLIAI